MPTLAQLLLSIYDGRCFMKLPVKLIMISLVTLIFSPDGFSSVTGSGRSGNARVYSAIPQAKGSFSLGYTQEFSRAKDVQFHGMNDLYGSQIGINYAPFSFIQLFLNQRTYLNNNSELLGSLHSFNFSKSELGSMITMPVASNYSVGIEPEFAIFNGNGTAFFEASSFGIRLLNTYTYTRGNETLKLHLNNQFFLDRSKKVTEAFNYSYFKQNQFYGLAYDNAVNHGLGLEREYPSYTPLVDYTLDQILKKGLPVFRSPHRLSGGLKFSPRKNSPWQVTLAGEKGFSKKEIDFIPLTPKWNAMVSISFADIPSKKIELVDYPIQPILPEPQEPKIEEKKTEEIQSEVKPLYPIYPIARKAGAPKAVAKKNPVTKAKKIIVQDTVKSETSNAAIPKANTPKTIEAQRPEKVDTGKIPLPDVVPSKDEFKTFSTEDPSSNNTVIRFK